MLGPGPLISGFSPPSSCCGFNRGKRVFDWKPDAVNLLRIQHERAGGANSSSRAWAEYHKVYGLTDARLDVLRDRGTLGPPSGPQSIAEVELAQLSDQLRTLPSSISRSKTGSPREWPSSIGCGRTKNPQPRFPESKLVPQVRHLRGSASNYETCDEETIVSMGCKFGQRWCAGAIELHSIRRKGNPQCRQFREDPSHLGDAKSNGNDGRPR